MASLYDTELTVMLDRAVLARTVTRRPRPSDPWFDVVSPPSDGHDDLSA